MFKKEIRCSIWALVFMSAEANDVVNFSLDLLPSILETRRAHGVQTFSVDGYASIERKGHSDLYKNMREDTLTPEWFKANEWRLSEGDITTASQYIDHGDPVRRDSGRKYELSRLAARVGVRSPEGDEVPVTVEELQEHVTYAVNARKISAEEGTQIMDDSRDERFRDAVKLLEVTRDAYARHGRPDDTFRAANVVADMSAWLKRNPEVTYEQAMDKARELGNQSNWMSDEALAKRPRANIMR